MKVLSSETNLSSATNVGNASVVRIFNSDSSAATVTRKDSGGSTIGTFTVGAGKVIYCEKNYTDTLEGGSTIKVSKTAHSHMMSYASYVSSGGGESASYVTDDLAFHIDAGNSSSYSGSGTTVNSLVGNITSTSYNSNISYSSSDGGYWTFDDGTPNPDTDTGIEFGIGNSQALNWHTKPFTFEIWARVNSSSANLCDLISFSWTPNSNPGYFYYMWFTQIYVAGGMFRHFWNHYSYYSRDLRYSSYNHNNDAGVWTHWVLTNDSDGGGSASDNANYKLYKNGSLESTQTTSNRLNYPTANANMFLNVGGNKKYPSRPFNGDISIVRLYIDKELSSSEVTQNFNAEKARYGY